MAIARIILILLLFASPAFAIEDSEDTMNIESVTILADSSMTLPVTEIARAYSRHANVDVNTVYENPAELLRKIEDGDPADIIITPSKKYFDQMREQGLIDNKSAQVIAANSLTIVAAKEMQMQKDADIKKVLGALHNKTLLIIGDPQTTGLGETTKEALQKLKIWPIFEKFVVLAPTSAKTIDLIIKGQGAGIVYATDAILYGAKVDNLGAIPTTMYPPVNYYAAIVVSDNMMRARGALKFLSSKDAKEILKNDGFSVR